MNEERLDLDLDKLKELKSEYKAKHADTEATISRLIHRRDGLQRLIEGLDQLIASEGDGSKYHESAVSVPPKARYGAAPASSQESVTTTNGLSEKPSRRELILRMLPEFRGETFTAREVREKYVEQYLEAEPPNFPQAINGLLQRMADRGEIEQVGRKGPRTTDPWLYREKSQGEALNLGP
jgi:hypothetical protein